MDLERHQMDRVEPYVMSNGRRKYGHIDDNAGGEIRVSAFAQMFSTVILTC